MRTILLLLSLASPASAQSLDLLIDIERAKAGLPVQAVDFDRTEAFNKLLRSQKPASKPQVAVKPPKKLALNKQPVTPPRLAAPISKTTALPLNGGHYEWRTRKVCKGGYCVTERYRVWVKGEPANKSSGYPVRGSWWSHPGSASSHLISEHGMNPAWVNSLTHAEQESLHSDLHDRRVKWSYVPR